ncbi:MAG: carboxypeptidase-like regulatory domain-containing protein [Planctomycetota bacterium]|jgi:hypothetical protein
MKKKTIKGWTISGLIVIGVVGCVFYLWYGQTHTGSRSGKVIDAVTGKPIEGAIVNYLWRTGGFMEVVDKSVAAQYETVTDHVGYYFIPNQRVRRKSVYESLHEEIVFIYKDGYAIYTVYAGSEVGRSFGYRDRDQKYRKKKNIVKLYLWKEGESHDKHISWIHSVTGYNRDYTSERLRKELQEEKKRARQEQIRRYRKE